MRKNKIKNKNQESDWNEILTEMNLKNSIEDMKIKELKKIEEKFIIKIVKVKKYTKDDFDILKKKKDEIEKEKNEKEKEKVLLVMNQKIHFGKK